jgi:hypothetical protein
MFASLPDGRCEAALVHETPEDLAELQALLDRSYAAAGSHLLSILTPERRLNAAQAAERLTGMSLLVLATVTADGRPIVGPVDGIFYRGALHFGSAPDSVRFRHIRSRAHVSATHLPSEELAVTVHGRAVPLDLQSFSTQGRSTPASSQTGCSPSRCPHPPLGLEGPRPRCRTRGGCSAR